MSAGKVVNSTGVGKAVSMGSNAGKAVIRTVMSKIVFESAAAIIVTGNFADGTYYANGSIFADGG